MNVEFSIERSKKFSLIGLILDNMGGGLGE